MAKSESSNRRIIGSKGVLEVVLSNLKGFERPKVRVEQYITDAEIAAEVLWNAKMQGDTGKVSADLGCGTGILGTGLLMLGESKVYFVDKDKDSLEIAKANFERVKSECLVEGKAVFLCKDVLDFNVRVNLVVQNPPFGVKVRHSDRVFLEKAFDKGKVVYSFHKSESKGFVSRLSRENGFEVTNVWDFKFPLKASYSYHTRKIKRIEVSCFRMEKVE